MIFGEPAQDFISIYSIITSDKFRLCNTIFKLNLRHARKIGAEFLEILSNEGQRYEGENVDVTYNRN